tara:strand:+ start:268 stop:3504 length:3237 start_codon:yes stop_codon:yes gene_type:complete
MKTFLLICFVLCAITYVSTQSILSDPNLKIWLIADSCDVDQSNLVSLWPDLSGNNHNFFQNTNTKKPLRTVSDYFENHKVLKFDGANDQLVNLQVDDINTEDLTVFILSSGLPQGNVRSGLFCVNGISNGLTMARNIGSSKYFRVWVNLSAGLNTGSQSAPNTYSPRILSYKREVGINSKIYLNGIQKGSNSSSGYNSSFTNGVARIGYAPNYQYFKGSIAEIVIYNRVLNESEQQEVEQYLMNKYAPPIDFGEDLTIDYGFCDTSLTSPNLYTSYLWNTGSTDPSIAVDSPGEYWLEVTDIFDRVSRDTIAVTMPLRDSLILDDEFSCFNEPLSINAFVPQGNYFFESWSDGNTNPTRILTENEILFYSVSDTNGCNWSSNNASMTVDNSLENISLGIDTSLCSGNTIELLQDTSVISNYIWNTGNSNPSQIVDTSGTYMLGVTNENGCENSDTVEVTVIGTAPTLSYSIENDICQGSPLNFTESSTVPPGNTINQVVWNFGETDSAFVSSGTHIYIDSGTFNSFLEVSTAEGCSSKASFDITVHPKPIVTFETSNYCPYDDIGFSANNEYNVPISMFNWDFDQNSNTSTAGNPTYNYGEPGNYHVELITIDSNSCIDTVIQTVFIQPAPVADIVILDPCEFSPLEISDNSTISDTFSIVSYTWEYGDNTSAVNPIEDKFFEEYGEYNVQLILTANNGCMDTVTESITVHPNPIINYHIDPACQNTWTLFEDMSTIPQGTITATNWLFNLQFEDNATSTYFNFPTTGIQLVALTSTSDQGCIVDSTFTVDVNQELSANFNIDPEVLVSDIPISYVNTSIGADSSYWDFGNDDGLNYNNSVENEITYSSLLNETYVDIVLMTVNEFGCRDTLIKTLLVNAAFYDINLETLFAQDINGFLTVGVEIENLGTIPIENLNLTLKTPENGPIKENWSGSILQAENEIYIFNTQPSAYISVQDENERFVCVEAQNANVSAYPDLNQENNTKCKNIEGEGLVLLSMFPNPSNQDITVSTLLSSSASLKIEFFDQTGRLAYKEQTPELISGIHSFSIPFSKFEKGVYTVRISDGKSSLVNKMIRH